MTKETSTLKWVVLRYWGMLFRTLFIFLLGIIGYWISPQPIGDIPVAQLTLNQILRSLIAVLIIGGCIYWFFNFPNEEKSVLENQSDNPYIFWGRFSTLVFLIGSAIAFLYFALVA